MFLDSTKKEDVIIRMRNFVMKHREPGSCNMLSDSRCSCIMCDFDRLVAKYTTTERTDPSKIKRVGG